MPDAAAHLVVRCAGVSITACTMQEATQLVMDRALGAGSAGSDVHLCNAYTLALADKDQPYRGLLNRATVNFPDGMSVVWANRWRHRDLDLPRERVCGPDLFLSVFDHGQQVGLRHYLLGSTVEVLTDLERELLRRFPEALVVGTESPPFRELTREEKAQQLGRIRDSGAQVVWVGLGTPKQDWAARALAEELPAVFVAVGAAFDFVAGRVKRAPDWMQRSGLEWAFRLGSEPRRLWKRYLVGNARFIRAALRGG